MLSTRIKERDLPEKVNVLSGRVNQTQSVAPPREMVANAPGLDESLISSQLVTERRIVVDPAPAEAIPPIPAYRPCLTADEREFLSYVASA